VHNFARECQITSYKSVLRFVATVPCKSLRHKSNAFHALLAPCTCLQGPIDQIYANQYLQNEQNTR